ncbi:hypothetical protein GJ496_003955 [Pomphorhynchus laevis]|nr:hypothetical protein GJ496_003955 [Pomphorhynchus laevis]
MRNFPYWVVSLRMGRYHVLFILLTNFLCDFVAANRQYTNWLQKPANKSLSCNQVSVRTNKYHQTTGKTYQVQQSNHPQSNYYAHGKYDFRLAKIKQHNKDLKRTIAELKYYLRKCRNLSGIRRHTMNTTRNVRFINQSGKIRNSKAGCPNPSDKLNHYKILSKIEKFNKQDVYLPGALITVQCADKIFHIICATDKQWYPRLPLCKVSCNDYPPRISNGIALYFDRSNGSIATYKCFPGFVLDWSTFWPKTQMQCINSKWVPSQSPKCLPVYCYYDPASLRNGKTTVLHRSVMGKRSAEVQQSPKVKHGQSLYFQCDTGYELIGPKIVNCIQGQWLPAIYPQCRIQI